MKPDALTITIDFDQACRRCRKPGACPNGLCLACNAKRLKARQATRKPRSRRP